MTQSRAEGAPRPMTKKKACNVRGQLPLFQVDRLFPGSGEGQAQGRKSYTPRVCPRIPLKADKTQNLWMVRATCWRPLGAVGGNFACPSWNYLRRRRCSETVLERLLGHCTRQALVATPALCVFEECHKLVRRSRHRTEPLSRVVGNEIQLTVSLLPLLVCGLVDAVVSHVVLQRQFAVQVQRSETENRA